jgi:Bacterial SH3 domain
VRKTITLSLALLSLTAYFFVPAAQAQDGAQPTGPAPNWIINCPGVRNVPMTADPQQSLPLQLIATLKCGDEVTVLANDEGYTVQIRTADGTIGYVAAMYLKKMPAARRPLTPNSVNLKNGVARWQEGAPGCDHFMSNGILVESLTVNAVTVQVSLHDTGWKLRANVAIANGGSESISIDPAKFILDEIGANGKPLFYQDPAELAKNVTHQVLWTESIAEPLTTSPGATNAAYTSSFTPTASAPNYILQHQYAEENAVRKEGKQTLNNTAQQILALALKRGDVDPNDKVAGAVWFERGKNPKQLMLRIPIGSQTLEFPLSFNRQK